MQVNGKTIVVTGGGNGIGREIVLHLLGKGARVGAVDISREALDETIARAGARSDALSTHVVDITDRTAVEALPAAVVEAHGQIDGLINCAGIIQPFVRVNDLSYDAIERVFRVNLWGTIHMTKTFLPPLLERPVAHILNVASMGAYVPVPGQTIYGSSKAAVKLFSEGLYSELASTNVAVTVAFPGATRTDISAHSGVGGSADAEADASKYKMIEPAESARIIVDAMERDAYHVFVGKDASFMDRLSRWAPKYAAGLIQKQMKDLLK
ncbi:MAG: SDR family oxidoreductase [Actinobacteria bacterium]|nr:MAG: SDR family oxidoreductase [Actinomycetota bacterium]